MERSIVKSGTEFRGIPDIVAGMEKLPISPDSARIIIKQSLRRGPVHMFADEADDAAKSAVRAMLAHWPRLFDAAEDKADAE